MARFQQQEFEVADPERPRPGRRLAVASLLVLALSAVLYFPARHAWFALQLLKTLHGASIGAGTESMPIVETVLRRPYGNSVAQALAYRRSGAPATRAAVLVPGISEQGCYHPRLRTLARSLAYRGFLVLTPDIVSFRSFQVDPGAVEEIAFWYSELRRLEDAAAVQTAGLAGVSFSGTMALIAAARPEVRDDIAFVLTIGAYRDPLECSRDWFAPGPVDAAGYYPTRFYARWITMRAALPLLEDPKERSFLDTVLLDLLRQKTPDAPPDWISASTARWYRLAVTGDADPELTGQIQTYLVPALYDRIRPDHAAEQVRCPVFLVHGSYDDLISPDESRRLARLLEHGRATVLISPFLTHTHPPEKPLSTAATIAAAWDIFRFFYVFARDVS